MSELETKTGYDILKEVDSDTDFCRKTPLSKKGLASKRWVSLESHEAAIKEAKEEARNDLAAIKWRTDCWNKGFEEGKHFKRDEFLVLLAEQRKKALVDLEKYGVSSFVYQKAKAKLSLLVLLEERLK